MDNSYKSIFHSSYKKDSNNIDECLNKLKEVGALRWFKKTAHFFA